MKLQIIVILLVIGGITIGLAQLGDEHITITVTSEGKAKVSQMLFPKTFVSTIDVQIISEKISNLLAIDEKDILLGTTQNQELLKIATLGASSVNLKYNADILSYESGVFRLKYTSDIESKVSLPPLSKLVSLNTIPIEITDKEYILPPGDISLSFSIRPVTSKEFFVPVGDSEYKIEAITAAKIEEFSANSDEIQFIIRDKAIVLTIIPTMVMSNPNDALLNGEKVEFSQFHQNSTHSWIRIDPHEKGLVRILNTSEKSDEGGGCLIATATFGSELAPQVQFLREIRDNQLMNTDSGISFMTGFNQFYYSFSPYIADYQRENPIFNEFVKIGITPLLSSLSIMTFAESEHEILGFGAGVILMNLGMYFVLPFVICYYVKTVIRTRRMSKSNLRVKFSCNVRSVLKTSLFGLIALLVLTVSVPSAFAQTTESDSPIRMVLDLTRENLVESLDSVDEIPSTAQTFYDMGQEEYQKALDALDSGDLEAAEEHALIAMALFEDSASVIGELEESLVLDQLPPGFGAAVDSSAESEGGLGVGDISPGIINQLSAANIFEISEEITDIDNEVEELRGLIESNNLNVNLEEYDKSINLAKEVLANGEIPNAQAKLALANQIKDALYDQIDAAVAEKQPDREEEFVENSRETIQDMIENGENLGLTKKAIKELEDVLDAIENGQIDEVLEKTNSNSELAKELDENDDETPEDAPGNGGDAPGQDKEDAPGNGGDAPGQNRGNEDAELPPGFEADGDNPENANEDAQGLGLGGIPPGLAKLFGYDDGTGDNKDFEVPEDIPGFGAAGDNPSENGFANGIGLGLGGENIPPGQLKKFDVSFAFNDNLDDYFENSFEGSAEDYFEATYDGTNRGHVDGKGLFGAFPGKSGEAPGQNKGNKDNSDDGNNGSGNDDNFTICHIANNNTQIVDGNALAAHLGHGDSLGACSTVPGIYDGEASTNTGDIGMPFFVNGFTAIANNNEPKDLSDITLNVIYNRNGSSAVPTNTGDQPFSFTPDVNGSWKIVASSSGLTDLIRVINVGGNVSPTVSVLADFSVNDNDPNVLLTATTDDPDGDNGLMTYSWVKTGITGNLINEDQEDAIFNIPNLPKGEIDREFTFTLTVMDELGAESIDSVTVIVINSNP